MLPAHGISFLIMLLSTIVSPSETAQRFSGVVPFGVAYFFILIIMKGAFLMNRVKYSFQVKRSIHNMIVAMLILSVLLGCTISTRAYATQNDEYMWDVTYYKSNYRFGFFQRTDSLSSFDFSGKGSWETLLNDFCKPAVPGTEKIVKLLLNTVVDDAEVTTIDESSSIFQKSGITVFVGSSKSDATIQVIVNGKEGISKYFDGKLTYGYPTGGYMVNKDGLDGTTGDLFSCVRYLLENSKSPFCYEDGVITYSYDQSMPTLEITSGKNQCSISAIPSGHSYLDNTSEFNSILVTFGLSDEAGISLMCNLIASVLFLTDIDIADKEFSDYDAIIQVWDTLPVDDELIGKNVKLGPLTMQYNYDESIRFGSYKIGNSK